MKRYYLFFFCCFLSFSSVKAQQNLRQVQFDVAYLASDLLEGRKSGSQGEALAAEYISNRFLKMGLEPKGEDGSWYHNFDCFERINPHDTGTNSSERIAAKNVVGFINNKAKTTVVIGAHYDHLGWGGHGSLHAHDSVIHNGADDNASGVAALLYLAEKLSKAELKNNNYLFIAFSGEELGLFGSKSFVNTPTINLEHINYMINMDMVGRLNEEGKLAISGTGTTPEWEELLESIHIDGVKDLKTGESGVGPSDHTSFYLKDIPVLHFFTGQHKDYHKPTDDAHLINYKGILSVSNFIYELIHKVDGLGKLAFTKTKDEQEKKSSFKVTLGVMPDYMYDGRGMRIDAVKDDRPAKNAGLEDGDIIIQIGQHEVKEIYSYMEALNKFEEGSKALVKVKRGDEVIETEVTF